MKKFLLLTIIACILSFVTESISQTKDNSGISKEILKELRDENGKKLLPDDMGDAIQNKTFNGNAGDHLGYSVESAGDMNGDGYDDVIIGADTYNSNTGKAYIYFGGVSMNTFADVVLTGEAITNYFLADRFQRQVI